VSSFTNSFKQSSLIFDKYFKDKLIALLGGDIEIVESITTNDMADKLDKLAGIDLWLNHLAVKCYGTKKLKQ